MSALTLAEDHGCEDAAVAALRDAFNAVEVTPADGGPTVAELDRADDARLTAVEALEARQQRRPQDGPRCIWPRPAPRPPAGPPVEPPITRVSETTWASWEAERQRRIDARPPPRRDARRAVAVALDAEYVDRDTASARCPICDGALAIRFRGELIDLECCDGCPPSDVERAVGVTS